MKSDPHRIQVRDDIDPTKLMEELAACYVAFMKNRDGFDPPSKDEVLKAAMQIILMKYNTRFL